ALSGIDQTTSQTINDLVQTVIIGILTQDFFVNRVRLGIISLRLLTTVARSTRIGGIQTRVVNRTLAQILHVAKLEQKLRFLEHPVRFLSIIRIALDDLIQL